MTTKEENEFWADWGPSYPSTTIKRHREKSWLSVNHRINLRAGVEFPVKPPHPAEEHGCGELRCITRQEWHNHRRAWKSEWRSDNHNRWYEDNYGTATTGWCSFRGMIW